MSVMANVEASFAAARWAVGAAWQVRRQVRGGRVDEVTVPAPPASCPRGRRSAGVALRLFARNCLVRSLVRQAWLAAAGDERDVVIGVRRSPDFGAHAWIDGDRLRPEDAFEELVRLPSR